MVGEQHRGNRTKTDGEGMASWNHPAAESQRYAGLKTNAPSIDIHPINRLGYLPSYLITAVRLLHAQRLALQSRVHALFTAASRAAFD